MQLTVLCDSTGRPVGMMTHPHGPAQEGDAQGLRLVAHEGHTVAIVETPSELAGREHDSTFFAVLRESYAVRDGRLTRHEQPPS